MNIVYIIDSLGSKGGAERILSEKMNYLATHFNYNVYVITCYQNPNDTKNAYFLSEKVKQINLCIPYYSQYCYNYPKRLYVKYNLYRKLISKLRTTILQIDPDVLIGLGYFIADKVCSVKCRAAKIIESHEARMFTMSNHGLSRSWLSRTYMKLYRKAYLKSVEQNADVVVTLTKGDAKEWRKAKRVEVIPNFTTMHPPLESYNLNSKRIISVGRLEWQKGYDTLVEIWKLVSFKHPDWELVIFGSGTLESKIISLINDEKLKNITIHPFTSDISHEYSQSSIFALSSRFEGFPLVLLEALQHSLPCIVFDCPFGPRDVIDDGICGYVIDNNIQLFAEKLSELIENDELRKQFSDAARKKAEVYNMDSIMQIWKNLFESLTK